MRLWYVKHRRKVLSAGNSSSRWKNRQVITDHLRFGLLAWKLVWWFVLILRNHQTRIHLLSIVSQIESTCCASLVISCCSVGLVINSYKVVCRMLQMCSCPCFYLERQNNLLIFIWNLTFNFRKLIFFFIRFLEHSTLRRLFSCLMRLDALILNIKTRGSFLDFYEANHILRLFSIRLI